MIQKEKTHPVIRLIEIIQLCQDQSYVDGHFGFRL